MSRVKKKNLANFSITQKEKETPLKQHFPKQKKKRFKINDLSFHLKKLEKEQIKLKARRKEGNNTE